MKYKVAAFTIGLLIATLLSGCSTIAKFAPSNFDNVEYGYLNELYVVAAWEDSCKKAHLVRIQYLSRVLKSYSANTLNDNVASIYAEINSLAEELTSKDNPSPVYCKLKRNNITLATERALEVFGGRVKS